MAEVGRRGVLRGVAGLAAGAVVAGCDSATRSTASSASGGRPVIAVDAGHRLAPVSRYMTGVNGALWYEEARELWDEAHDTPDARAVARIKDAGVALVRYPGGTSANLFRWKNAIGRQDQRKHQVSGRSARGPEDSRFGPDEYMKLTAAIGGMPQIMAAFANTTPQEIADWVSYMNAPRGTEFGDLRAQNGHPDPYGVHYWEVGNELHNSGQRYWMSDDDATAQRQYAFGGTQKQKGQRLGTPSDHRPRAGTSSGAPHQSFTLWYPPAVPDSQTVYVDRKPWRHVDDLDSAGADDAVYTFEPTTGTVRFGDGTHGKIPPKGAGLTADYESGPHAGFVDYYKAMKEADPTIAVLACWAPMDTGKPVGTSFPALLASHGHGDDFDGLAVHPYTNFKRDLHITRFPDRRAGHDYQMLGDTAAAGVVADLQGEVRKHGKDGAFVAVSECGALFFGQKKNSVTAYPTFSHAMSHALYMASQWAHYSNLGLPWSAGNDLIAPKPGEARQIFGGKPDYALTPDAVVRGQLRGLFQHGGHIVRNEVHGDAKVGTRKTPLGDSYPALTTTAAVASDGTLTVLVVNRSPDQSVTAEIAPQHAHISKPAEVTVVSGDSYHDTKATPPKTSHVTPKSGRCTLTFAAHSVTLVRFPTS